jgi:hypothetical protein
MPPANQPRQQETRGFISSTLWAAVEVAGTRGTVGIRRRIGRGTPWRCYMLRMKVLREGGLA